MHRAAIKAKLEPYLGFLHSMQYGKPSFVCDLQEPYRYLMDDFVIQFCQDLSSENFTLKDESVSRNRKGKKEYLKDSETSRMMKELNGYFKSKLDVPHIKCGKKQAIEIMINEESLLLVKYLRDEKNTGMLRA